MDHSIVAGVDVGGSHITVALIDMDQREILPHTWQRLHVDSQGSAQSIFATWCSAIEESFNKHNAGITTIGIAMPGPFDYANGISLMHNQNKYDALYNLNVKAVLAEKLLIPTENIVLNNDAECYLKGEVFGGVAKGYSRVIGVTLGTGLGSAIAINDQVRDADLWHAPFKDGIAEDYLSNRWFVKRYFELTGENVADVKELVALTEKASLVQQVFDEFGYHLGLFLSPYIHQQDIEIVVLGGNITQAYPLFAAALQNALKGKQKVLAIKRTVLGEHATLIGAASYCLAKTPQH